MTCLQLYRQLLNTAGKVGMLTSLLEPQSFPEGLPRAVGAASEGVLGVPGADPDSPLLKRALTSDFARRSRSAAPENKPAKP